VNSGTLLKQQGWERSDFPILCDTCLGDNPYVRMTKAEFDKECKICSRPFTVFRWRPGRNARFKKTEICQTCAKMKNVCQTCLLDLDYGIPVQARDTLESTVTGVQAPQSDVMRMWLAEQADRQLATGQVAPGGRTDLRPILSKLGRSAPYLKRNEPHLCSFFLKGKCTRGSECPYKHEVPEQDPELQKQNFKDRYYGTNDPVANKLLNKVNIHKLQPPNDPDIKTLCITNVDTSAIAEQDIRDAFYPYGELTEVKVIPKSSVAFVTYASRADAEKAAEKLQNNLNIKDIQLRLHWGRSQSVDAPKIPPPAQAPIVPPPPPTTDYFGLAAPSVPAYQPYAWTPDMRQYYPSMNPERVGSMKRDR